MQIGSLVPLLTFAALAGTVMQEKQEPPADDRPTAEAGRAPQTKPVDVTESLKVTVVAMDQVVADLKKDQVSSGTIEQQRKILGELDRLVNFAESLPSPKRGRPSDGARPPGPKVADPVSNSKDARSQPSDSSIGPHGSAATGETPAEQRRVLIRQVWGHLPPSLQRRVLTGTNEKPVPKYRRLIKKYFEALAESSRRGPTSTGEFSDR